MVQNEFELKNQADHTMFASSSLLVEGKNLWLLTTHTDVLMCFQSSDMRLMEYYIVPAQYLQKDVHARLQNANDGIYILPCMGNDIFYFSKTQKTMRKISLTFLGQEHANKRKFHTVAFWKGHLFLIGYDIGGIYDLDEETGNISKEETYLDMLRSAGAETEGTIFSDCACQDGNMLYLPLTDQPFILCMNLDERSFHVFRLSGEKNFRLCTIDKCADSRSFFLTTSDDEKIIWSPKKGLEGWKELGMLKKEKKYLCAYHVNDKYYYIPANERKIYVEKEGKIRNLPYEYPSNTKYPEHDTIQYEMVDRYENVIYFQARDGHLFYIDTENDEIHGIKFSVSTDQISEMKKRILEVRNIPATVHEKYCFHLGDYLQMVVKGC